MSPRNDSNSAGISQSKFLPKYNASQLLSAKQQNNEQQGNTKIYKKWFYSHLRVLCSDTCRQTRGTAC